MDIFKTFYSDFFTAGALIPTFFHFYLSFLFLRSIPDRSKSTFNLGMAFLFMCVFNFAYFIAGSFYHPVAAFHRWLTVGVILVGQSHFNMFMFHIHEEQKPLVSKIFLGVQYGIAFSVSAVFFFMTFSAEKIFHFDGHYWDFNADVISKIVGIIIFVYLLVNAALMIWKVVVIKSRDRWLVMFIGITYLLATIIPSIANILSRDGALDRGTFQIAWDLFNILGFFLMSVLYINYTKDRTTFMAKIMGISLVTMLVVLQGLSYYSFQDQEKAYDIIHRSYTRQSVLTDYRSPDTRYLVNYSPREKTFKVLHGTDSINRPGTLEPFENQYLNTMVWEKIRYIDDKDYFIKVNTLLENSHKYFRGYKNALSGFMKKLEPGERDLSGKTLAYLKSLNRPILFYKNKIKKIKADENFRSSLGKLIAKGKKELKPFNAAMEGHMKVSSSEGKKLKEEVLQYLDLTAPAGYRHYRDINGTHFVSYMLCDGDLKTVYEAGFSYIQYRNYVHPSAMKLILMLMAILVVVLLGFRFFFLGAMVNPLQNLLQGLQDVRKGNLDVSIPVKVEDEIGILTHNFNRMVLTISKAKKQLDDYAESLEVKVEERTAELKRVSDALWGEMQLAKKIQTVLLPREPVIKRYEIIGFMDPADEVGGDYYDIINGKDVDWVFIGDVSGHGVSAGIIMMMAQTAIQSILRGNSNLKPSLLLKVADKAISYNINKMDEDKYMTITAFAFHRDGRVVFSGLHQDILIYRSDVDSVESIATDGLWLGLSIDLGRITADFEFTVNAGDVVLLYTDGITESRDKNGIMYGQRKLAEVLNKSGKKSSVDIRDDILSSLQGYDNDDDLTLVILKCVG